MYKEIDKILIFSFLSIIATILVTITMKKYLEINKDVIMSLHDSIQTIVSVTTGSLSGFIIFGNKKNNEDQKWKIL